MCGRGAYLCADDALELCADDELYDDVSLRSLGSLGDEVTRKLSVSFSSPEMSGVFD